ncbi:MAG: SPFH domain-containing protein, partial [Candidatus Palauibacterales bacterium]|nr:SPFH domain-containing protein [Candidatus Palauibacterales bacterium]
LRSVIGQAELDELLAEREKFNHILQRIIDEGTDVWGIDVTGVEVKDVDLPQEMKRAMARQAEAERERRAKVINAEGELQAASRLKDAARLLSLEPASLQLRFLQTASEIAAENNSTTLFPLPVDLFTPFKKLIEQRVELSAEEKEEIAALEARAHKAVAEATGLSMPSRISESEAPGLLGEGEADTGLPNAERKAVRVERKPKDD